MQPKCNKCGKCCANILFVSQEEVIKIKKYISVHNIKPINRQSILTDYIDICPFLNKNNQCNIYEVRPNICKTYKCFNNQDYTVSNINDYRYVNVINMLTTFYPKENCPNVDTTTIETQLNKHKNKLYGRN